MQRKTTLGAAGALYVMLGGAALIDLILAFLERKSPFGSTLTYWDEAVVFIMLALIVRYFFPVV